MRHTIYYISLLMLTLMFFSCKDEISMESMSNQRKLVVYCMPAATDTTYIRVCKSLPIRSYNDSAKIDPVDDARITYTVNGQPQTANAVGNGFYRVNVQQHAGDRISIRVEVDNMEPVTAESTIPTPVAIENVAVREARVYDAVDQNAYEYDQVSATFTDDPSTHNYYAVRVRLKHYRGVVRAYSSSFSNGWVFTSLSEFRRYRDAYVWDSLRTEVSDSAYSYPIIYTQSEELLLPVTAIDDNFGFSNDFYGNFCVFDDTNISGRTYTLHLNISRTATYYGNTPEDGSYMIPYEFDKQYQVELYSITPEYYHYLQAINDVNNNELAQGGFSQIRPMVSNITGGMGLMGAWNKEATGWVRKEMNP